ncbi:hypothetical protein D9756_003927 [Leucocoprinus leucothites]|uniref:Uncharacterized protein n=1 Tax=Leucocoprinus leucothites TaxID=201217 RepID=A0A8H5DA25_9AGAR|nr:hypothetical protein D9756_003927 [Leucoagaricus leucothites]
MNNPPVVSETSRLLPSHNSEDDLDIAPVTPVVQSLEIADLTHLRWEDLTPRPLPASLEVDQCKRLAFALIVLLQLRKQKIAWGGGYPDAYEQWTEEEARARDVETLEEKMSELWENFLAQYHGPRELHDVLWTQFLLEQGRPRKIRVVDCLLGRDAPSKFVAHPIVSMTISRTWKYGRPASNRPQSLLHNIISTEATPCATHFLELLFDLGFMLLLFSYVIRPPNWPDSEVDRPSPASAYPYSTREVCIVIYAFSVLVSAQGANVIISAFTLLAFASSPSVLPLPGGPGFYILLWVVVFRFLMYHMPSTLPSPVLLFQHRQSLPLAVLLSKGLARIARPLFRFYLPTALVTCFTLSLSMSGPLAGPLEYFRGLQAPLPLPGSDMPIIGVAPMDTRVVFFLLSLTIWLLIISSVYIIASSTPVARTDPAIRSPSILWDTYSPEVGHIARITSYRATVAYAIDYPFPPPLNLVELLLVTIPVGFIRLFRNPHFKRAIIARLIWNVTVRPLILIMTPLCTLLA